MWCVEEQWFFEGGFLTAAVCGSALFMLTAYFGGWRCQHGADVRTGRPPPCEDGATHEASRGHTPQAPYGSGQALIRPPVVGSGQALKLWRKQGQEQQERRKQGAAITACAAIKVCLLECCGQRARP